MCVYYQKRKSKRKSQQKKSKPEPSVADLGHHTITDFESFGAATVVPCNIFGNRIRPLMHFGNGHNGIECRLAGSLPVTRIDCQRSYACETQGVSVADTQCRLASMTARCNFERASCLRFEVPINMLGLGTLT